MALRSSFRNKTLIKRYVSVIILAVISIIVVLLCYKLITTLRVVRLFFIPESETARYQALDELRLFRDLVSQSDSVAQHLPPGVRVGDQIPAETPATVHYVWCGRKYFKFEEYLGILSIVRVVRPLKIVFHYNELPVVDRLMYHTWFHELRQSLPNLVLRRTEKQVRCNTMDAVNFAIEQIASNPDGGLYFGERAVLTHIPQQWKHGNYFTYAKPGFNSSEQTIIFINQGLNRQFDLEAFKSEVMINHIDCLSPYRYEELVLLNKSQFLPSPCVALPTNIYPEHILSNSSPFNELLRWLYYGRTGNYVAKQSQDSPLVPMICHMITLNPDPGSPVIWDFQSYLSVLSALYVGGFERVYVHGDTRPSGLLWDKLQGENITFVYVESPETVYQQAVNVLAHKADVLRILILHKYGGVYNDLDVIWVRPISEKIRRYPTTMCLDWPKLEEWPRTGNIGTLVSKPNAPFLVKLLDSFWYYRDDIWEFNAVAMPYKVYERNPETVYIDKKLQVFCFQDICHPVWHDNYLRDYRDTNKTKEFDILEPNVFHFIHQNAGPIYTSFAAIQNNRDIPAILGQRVIQAVKKSGKNHLLDAW